MSISPIDGAIQKAVPHLTRPVIFHLAQQTALAGPIGEIPMYVTLRHKYFWPNMSTDVYSTVWHCQDCNRVGALFNRQAQVQLFHPVLHPNMFKVTFMPYYHEPNEATNL